MKNIYVVSDLHGRLDLYNAIMKTVKSEDEIICLGDCGDRGPNSWETVKAVASDPQWTYLMGNHEHMLAAAMCEYLDDPRQKIFSKYYDESSMIQLLYHNGGEETLDGWIKDGANPEWISFLLRLKISTSYINQNGNTIYLSHAGYTPSLINPNKIDLIWGREHFLDPWPDNHDNDIIIHGHTSCPFLAKELSGKFSPYIWKPEDGAIWYNNCHKIDIDMGAYVTNVTLLFNLDTFDEMIISI